MLVSLIPNLTPKRHKDEYAGPCPWCGGEDRFLVWAEADRYWCRQCQRKGDAIQYLRDFEGLSYREACARAGKTPTAPVSRPDPRLTVLTYLEEQIDLLCGEYGLLLMEKASMARHPNAWDLCVRLDHYKKEVQLQALLADVRALLEKTFPGAADAA